MRKYYTLLIFLSAFFSANAQDIFFIDAGLKARLLATNTTNQAYAQDQDHNYIAIDGNADGEIQQSEALAVYHLDIAYIDLYDLTDLNISPILNRSTLHRHQSRF